MTAGPQAKRPISLPHDLVVIVGGYGSGKSEVSVNLARHFRQTGAAELAVSVADLDIVNPYFRSREASRELERIGIRPINPTGGNFFADLPIILPEIKGAIAGGSGKLILDVGGDDAGSRVLSSLADAFVAGGYDMLMVLNASRPFTADLAGCLRTLHDIEGATTLKFTGLISNTHMMDDTTPTEVLAGLDLARQVSSATRLPIVFVSVVRELYDSMDLSRIEFPVLCLDRWLLKPWEHRQSSNHESV